MNNDKTGLQVGDLVLSDWDIEDLLKQTMREMGHTEFLDTDGKVKEL